MEVLLAIYQTETTLEIKDGDFLSYNHPESQQNHENKPNYRFNALTTGSWSNHKYHVLVGPHTI